MDTQTNQVPPSPPTGLAGQNGPKKSIMETLEYYFVTKAPFQLPVNAKEFIVKFGPWINLIFLLTFLPLLLAILGLNALISTYSYSYAVRGWSLSSIISVVTVVMGIIALPGLFARKISGWNMAFYEVVVSLVGGIIAGNIIGALIGAVIGSYVLFQIKSYYK
jgi:hypothetical protein